MTQSNGSCPATILRYFGGVDAAGTVEGFMDALTIWINKPHVVNRRLCGSRIKHYKHFRDIDELKLGIRNILDDNGYIISHLTQTASFLEIGCDKICQENGQNSMDLKSASSDVSRVDKMCSVGKVTQLYAEILNSLNKMDASKTNVDLEINKEGKQKADEIDTRAKHNRNTNDRRTVPEVDSHTPDEISSLCCTEDKHIAAIVRELLPKQPERHRNIPELIVFGSHHGY